MKARLIKKDGEILLLCENGSITRANNSILRELFICFKTIGNIKGNGERWDKTVKNMSKYPGTTLAYVNNQYELCLVENPFLALMQNVTDDEYITLHEYAELHKKNDNRIKALCREGRLMGATKKAGKWFIPKHTPYPKDARYSGVEK